VEGTVFAQVAQDASQKTHDNHERLAILADHMLSQIGDIQT
jgi:hypothetical protein